MQDLIDDMSNIEVVVAKLRQPSVEEPVKDITHSDKYIVNSNESEKLPESGHILKKHADLRDLNKREPSGKGFELSRYDNWRDVDKWSNEEKALILDHTPMHIWRNIAGDLLSFRTECKKNRSRCTRQVRNEYEYIIFFPFMSNIFRQF